MSISRRTGDIVGVELVVGDVEKATVLVQVDHLGVHARQTERKLGKAPQRQVIGHLHTRRQHQLSSDQLRAASLIGRNAVT